MSSVSSSFIGYLSRIAWLGILLCSSMVTSYAADEGQHTPVPQDKIGYSLGYEFGRHLSQLKQQGATLEMESILQGMTDAQSGSTPKLSSQEMQSLIDGIKPAVEKSHTDTNKALARTRPARASRYIDDYAKLNAKREGVVVLASGVQYEILKPGSGKQIQSHDTVSALYEAKLPSGVVFDSTNKEGKPALLHLDEVVVPGLKEALLLMQEGAKWRIVIPPKMGFANAGNNMLRNRDLIYELEVIQIEAPDNK